MSIPINKDPSSPPSLLARLHLDSPTASGASSPSPSVKQRRKLSSARLTRALQKDAIESALFEPVAFDSLPEREGLDPATLKGKTLFFPEDEGPITRDHARNLFLQDSGGRKCQIRLSGFHHATDEEDRDDLELRERYILRTSGRWDALFDPEGDAHHSVKIHDATYGTGRDAYDGVLAFGISWADKGAEQEPRYGWIWGELEYESEDEDEEYDGEEDVDGVTEVVDGSEAAQRTVGGDLDARANGDRKEPLPSFKSVHLVEIETGPVGTTRSSGAAAGSDKELADVEEGKPKEEAK